MKLRSKLSVLVALIVSGPVVADVAPPAGTKLVPVTGEIEAAEEFPEYRFFLADRRTYHGPPRDGVKDLDREHKWRSDVVVTEAHLRTDSPVRATGGRRDTTSLYVVPRSVVDRFPEFEVLVRAVDQGQVPGASGQVLGSATTIPQSDSRDKVIVRYRLARSPSGEGIAITQLDDPPEPGTASPRVKWVFFSIALAATMVTLVFWWAGRNRVRPAATPNTEG